jgi:beta-lactamase regulating signal transducer with metallopeptidase domain
MHEHIAHAMHHIEVHLFCASMVWVSAWTLTSIIRRGPATWKYWIWVATSLNFVLPLDEILAQFRPWRPSWTVPLTAADAVRTNMFTNPRVLAVLWAVWSLGAVLMLFRLSLRLRAERRAVQVSAMQSPFYLGAGPFAPRILVSFSASQCGPAVHGFLRPQILLPDGIDRLLDEQELNAVLIHERKHARRRDNLICLIHEVTLCVLWFHPFVWITGRRLALYRELSCDDAVIESAHGGHLISALAKLALPEDTRSLHAAASSFLEHRLARLMSVQPQRRCTPTNVLSIAAFSVVLLAGVLGALPQMAVDSSHKPNTWDRSATRNNSSSEAAHTEAPGGGLKSGIPGGIFGGVPGGISGGVPGGVRAGVRGGVSNGVASGIS